MVSIADVLRWQPERLPGIADSVNGKRHSVQDVITDLPDGAPPGSWTGWDAAAATVAHRQLASNLDACAAPMAKVVSALDTAATSCARAKQDLQDALRSASSQGFEVDQATGTVTDPHTYHDHEQQQAAAAALAEVARQIGDALKAAESADDDLAHALLAQTESALGHDIAGNGITRSLVDAVDKGGPLDDATATLALKLPSTSFSKAGQAALRRWLSEHPRDLGRAMTSGGVNVPPSPVGSSYGGEVIDTPTYKLKYDVTLPADTGAVGLTVTGLNTAKPSLEGSLTDGHGSVSLGDDGTVTVSRKGPDDTSVRVEDGTVWYVVSHKVTLTPSHGQPVELTVTQQTTTPPPDPPSGTPEPLAVLKTLGDGAKQGLLGLGSAEHAVVDPIVNAVGQALDNNQGSSAGGAPPPPPPAYFEGGA